MREAFTTSCSVLDPPFKKPLNTVDDHLLLDRRALLCPAFLFKSSNTDNINSLSLSNAESFNTLA
jgi:hypothetical protein